ncbi:cleavage stimulation factor subunit 2 tau variant-like [Ctenocephalides felis]|uniref:cleavage stimulation factor subunit 2 tau variant-like n=1 Tax=Ctenocephalides felis TaxID=7515 RepID=UPI000E6E43CE|nr:cleavage stimulation factor subunit 2 tau variant-like [Ctenocephalides felis]
MDFGRSVFNSSNQTDDTPAAISKAVACLPAGQMFELMIQMKGCIQNNAIEARTMLAKNPQLTYALLHAQILLNIVDPKDFLATMTAAAPSAPATVPAPSISMPQATIKAEPGLTQQQPTAPTPNIIPQPVPAPVMIPGLGGNAPPRPVAAPQPVPAPTMVPQPSIVPPPQIVPQPSIVQKQPVVFPKQPVMVPNQQPMMVPNQQPPMVAKQQQPMGGIKLPQAQPMPVVREQPSAVAAPQTNIYSDTDFRASDPRMLRSNQPSGDQDMRSMLARPTPTESTAAPSDPRSRPPEVARNDPRLARGIMPTRPPPTSMAPPRPAPASNAPTTDQER